MSKYLLLILLTAFSLLEVACQEIPQQSKHAEPVSTLSFMKKDGILQSKEGSRICLIADDAIEYEVFVSPDAMMIAVETLLMSNLQIIRIYKKDTLGCFQPLKDALSTKLWHDLSVKEGFMVEHVSRPRMKFLKWVSNKQIEVELSGEVDKRSISANVRFEF